MKTIPIALAAHQAQPATSLAHCILIERADGELFGLTSLDVTLTVAGTDYAPGFDASNLVSQAGFAVDNLELRVLKTDDVLTDADILAGRWRNAQVTIFAVNWKVPADGIDTLATGTTGEATINQGVHIVELRGLKQALQQPVGIATQRTCRARFADFPTPIYPARCRLDPADWTVTGALTAVTDRRTVTDSARTEADDWYGEGIFTFTSGLNDKLAQKVKVFASGAFEFSLPFAYLPEVGDTYSVIAGCRKRHDVDCRDKFNNILNFQGEPHTPGQDALTRAAI